MLSFHVGIMKTGTSSIQRFFKENTFDSVKFLDSKKATSSRHWLDEISAQYARALADGEADHLVFSSEGFLGRGSSLYPSLHERATQLRNRFDGVGLFQVIVFFRPQIWWLESMARQGLQSAEFSTLETAVSPLIESKYFRFSLILDILIEIFGPENVVVRAQSGDMNAVETFLDLLALPTANAQEASRINVSLSPVELDLLARIRQREGVGDWHPRLARWFFQRFLSEGRSGGFSVLKENVQEFALATAIDDWPKLMALVAETKNSSLEAFESSYNALSNYSIRPYFDPQVDVDVLRDELVDILCQVIPALQSEIIPSDKTKKIAPYRVLLEKVFKS